MRTLLLFFALFGSLFASAPQYSSRSDDKWLIWVTFAPEDDTSSRDTVGHVYVNHSEIRLYISEKSRGDQLAYVEGMEGDVRGGSGPDPDTHEKWQECTKILKAIGQPKDLPSLATHIVTLTCVDGDSRIIRKFPIDHVPNQVYQILTIMGFSDDKRLVRLNFDK